MDLGRAPPLPAHAEFVSQVQAGRLPLTIDRTRAARFVSARLLLPFVTLPVLGAGVALALVGWFWSGLAVIAFATLAPLLIKRAAPDFVLKQALADPAFYGDAVRAGVLRAEQSDP